MRWSYYQVHTFIRSLSLYILLMRACMMCILYICAYVYMCVCIQWIDEYN